MSRQGKVEFYNYITKQYDPIDIGTIPDYTKYIPQDAPVQNLYSLLIEMGKSPTEAALEVLNKYIPSTGGDAE